MRQQFDPRAGAVHPGQLHGTLQALDRKSGGRQECAAWAQRKIIVRLWRAGLRQGRTGLRGDDARKGLADHAGLASQISGRHGSALRGHPRHADNILLYLTRPSAYLLTPIEQSTTGLVLMSGNNQKNPAMICVHLSILSGAFVARSACDVFGRAAQRWRWTVLAALALFIAVAGSGRALAEPPRLWDPGYRTATVDLGGLQRLRFLTSLDFPPFNFADANRKPTGFNVDLARAVCEELDLVDRCEIQAMPWEELEASLEARRGEVILAGHAPDASLRARFGLSEPYFRFPARFVGRDADGDDEDGFDARLAQGKVAVVANSPHAEMLAAFFPDAEAMPVADMPAAYTALREQEADLVFGDGVLLSFWLTSPAADDCCRFLSGPYMSDRHLGQGMVAVTRTQDQRLLDAINGALKAVEDSGAYAEIYARYFPVDPFGT
ncbi:transporter substrate-binding domain-containing protein [Roseitalea porphyridii]|uniref:transporter substrate-binding domain-containing protein n=1 Tax=Roseitalea porphyridii TaxID=1852022 RepID=UPI0013158016|nr:transporter substrate-binding domain-containing protein [Roseitalea porphyridii]